MLQAMSTGHDGSLATCHANGALDALRRVETMVSLTDPALAGVGVREQIAAAIDLVVHLVRGPDGTRRIAQIAEVEPTPPLAVRVLARNTLERLPSRAPRRPTSVGLDDSWIGR
jgi:pilus assembly protein CpaF